MRFLTPALAGARRTGVVPERSDSNGERDVPFSIGGVPPIPASQPGARPCGGSRTSIAMGAALHHDRHRPAARNRPLRRGFGCSAGRAFSLGLILVVVAGAELFTGNNLVVDGLGQPTGLDAPPGFWILDRRLRRELHRVRSATAGLTYGDHANIGFRGGGVVGELGLADCKWRRSSRVSLRRSCSARSATRLSASRSGSRTARGRLKDEILAVVPPIAASLPRGIRA